VWGFLTMFLQKQGGGAFPEYITFLIGGIILWDALFRAQQGVSISFLEDVWTRNLLNIFAAPVRMTDYIAATFGVGILRVAITAGVRARPDSSSFPSVFCMAGSDFSSCLASRVSRGSGR